MIRLESGSSDCTMEAGFRENSVYSAYTPAIKASTAASATYSSEPVAASDELEWNL